MTWVPVETAINNAVNDNVKSDGGEVQRFVDADGDRLPYQTHFSHVEVSSTYDYLTKSH